MIQPSRLSASMSRRILLPLKQRKKRETYMNWTTHVLLENDFGAGMLMLWLHGPIESLDILDTMTAMLWEGCNVLSSV